MAGHAPDIAEGTQGSEGSGATHGATEADMGISWIVNGGMSLPEGSTDSFFLGASEFLDKQRFWNDFCRHEIVKMEPPFWFVSFFG